MESSPVFTNPIQPTNPISLKTKYIPFLIESLPHPQIPFKKIEKVKFYISLKHHREEWKGKDELYSALYKLYYRHPSACEIKQTVFTPYDECEHFMDGCDVMLDQLYSYSPGLNALYAMSKGIVVVGGAEEEHYNLLGEDRLRPIINVRPEGNDIYNNQRVYQPIQIKFLNYPPTALNILKTPLSNKGG